jgi:uncharacterized protein (DUF433 family)
MQLEEYFVFQGPNAIRIKGHRIGIEHILSCYRGGYTPDEIAEEFPGVSLEKIYATITYYLSRREEIDAYLARLRERSEQEYQEWAANPSPLVQRLRAARRQDRAISGLTFPHLGSQ